MGGLIPEDVQKAADKVASLDGGEPGCHLSYLVARAILAERQRCADVASRFIKYPCPNRDDEIETCTAEKIEQGILSP